MVKRYGDWNQSSSIHSKTRANLFSSVSSKTTDGNSVTFCNTPSIAPPNICDLQETSGNPALTPKVYHIATLSHIESFLPGANCVNLYPNILG